jgi:predicted DNA-binding protein (UPF0251 family)
MARDPLKSEKSSDKRASAKSFYESVIAQHFSQIESSQKRLTDEEHERMWKRACDRVLLPRKVKKLEEQNEQKSRQIKDLQDRLTGLMPAKVVVQPTRSQLPPKERDYSEMFDAANLTDVQRETASLAWEYGLRPTQIAKRLGKHRKTVEECLAAARKKVDESLSKERRAKKRAEKDPGC